MPATLPTLLAAAAGPGHAHLKANLGPVPAWLAHHAAAHTPPLANFHHTIDTAAIRHILKHRGNLAVTEADLQTIAAILATPDKIILGATNKRRQPIIAYLKIFPTHITLYLEEARTGARELAALTMRKYPTTIDAGKLAASFDLYGRTDRGATMIIVDNPANVTPLATAPAATLSASIAANLESNGRTGGIATNLAHSSANVITKRKTRLLRFLPPALGLLVLAGIVFALHGTLAHTHPRDIIAALAATPAAGIARALALLAASLCIMAIYDLPGILFAKKLPGCPRIGIKHVALASFSAYALSHVLGAPALTAAAIRLRLYAQWRVPAAGIARIIALSGSMFVLGAAALACLILLLSPAAIPLFGHDISTAALTSLGAALAAAILAYIYLAGRPNQQLVILGRPVALPGSLLAATQMLIAAADITVAASILFAVLPATPGLTLPETLAIYLAAFAGGLFSGLPGGLGVFDTLLLLALSSYMPPATAIGAILLFRIIYYLAPACLAALCFAAHEIFLTAKSE